MEQLDMNGLLDSIAVPVPTRAHDVYSLCLIDIAMLIKRIDGIAAASEIVRWNDGDRMRHDDIVSAAISTAELASLVAFGRPGETWRLEAVTQDEARGSDLMSALHRLRSVMMSKMPVISRLRNAPRVEQAALDEIVTAVSLLALALDAVPAHLVREFALLAGLGRTNDAQGDAQLRAEEISLAS